MLLLLQTSARQAVGRLAVPPLPFSAQLSRSWKLLFRCLQPAARKGISKLTAPDWDFSDGEAIDF